MFSSACFRLFFLVLSVRRFLMLPCVDTSKLQAVTVKLHQIPVVTIDSIPKSFPPLPHFLYVVRKFALERDHYYVDVIALRNLGRYQVLLGKEACVFPVDYFSYKKRQLPYIPSLTGAPAGDAGNNRFPGKSDAVYSGGAGRDGNVPQL